jgi:hypothetical protein
MRSTTGCGGSPAELSTGTGTGYVKIECNSQGFKSALITDTGSYDDADLALKTKADTNPDKM